MNQDKCNLIREWVDNFEQKINNDKLVEARETDILRELIINSISDEEFKDQSILKLS